jgi:hypothetical protein
LNPYQPPQQTLIEPKPESDRKLLAVPRLFGIFGLITIGEQLGVKESSGFAVVVTVAAVGFCGVQVLRHSGSE